MDLSPELIATLYSTEPDRFLAVRVDLSAAAKSAGEPDLARAIAAQRKPTIAAWLVNRHVHAEPDVVDRLLELGTRLRAAHESLDAAALRELSAQRRQLVADAADAALAAAGRPDPGAALRDDVSATFDAAVADPEIASRLGRLTKPERWSGFGVAMDVPAGAPDLTVIRGGRHRTTRSTSPPAAKRTARPQTGPASDSPDRAAPTAGDRAAARRSERARRQAADAFAAADAALQQLQDAEQSAARRIKGLTADMSRLQRELDAAKQEHDRSRRNIKAARNRRKEARSALDRAERPRSSD